MMPSHRPASTNDAGAGTAPPVRPADRAVVLAAGKSAPGRFRSCKPRINLNQPDMINGVFMRDMILLVKCPGSFDPDLSGKNERDRYELSVRD